MGPRNSSRLASVPQSGGCNAFAKTGLANRCLAEGLFAALHRLPSHMLAHYIGCQLGRGVENVLPEARVSVEQP